MSRKLSVAQLVAIAPVSFGSLAFLAAGVYSLSGGNRQLGGVGLIVGMLLGMAAIAIWRKPEDIPDVDA